MLMNYYTRLILRSQHTSMELNPLLIWIRSNVRMINPIWTAAIYIALQKLLAIIEFKSILFVIKMIKKLRIVIIKIKIKIYLLQ